jgi:hypothetical protein
MAQANDLESLKKGVALLSTCIAQTLDECSPGAKDKFLAHLATAYRELRDNSEGDQTNGLEMLSWTRELLTGFSVIKGPDEPFLKD